MNNEQAMAIMMRAFKYDPPVGSWKAEFEDGLLVLSHVCRQEQYNGVDDDAPWTQWGGNEIIGDEMPGGSGVDQYEKFGHTYVAQWATWRVND